MMPYAKSLAAVVILLALIFAVTASHKRRVDAVRFFSDTLTAHDVQTASRENLAPSDDSYAGNLIRAQALSLTYEQLLARRSPLLGAAGIDTEALRRGIKELARSQKSYAAAQVDPRDATAVREALYPISFLQKIADLEDARRAFIASGSERDARVYRRLLRETADSGLRAAKTLQSAIDAHAGDKNFVFPGIGGTITRKSFFTSLKTLTARFESIAEEVHDREQCLRGAVAECRPIDIDLSLPEAPAQTKATAFTYVPFPPWAASATPSFVVLQHSACLGTQDAPYVFAFLSGDFTSRAPFIFRGDIFYAPTAGAKGESMQYLRENLGIEYSVVNPLEFYLCPDVAEDLGIAAAVHATTEFGRAHDGYATTSRARLLAESSAQERLARAYIRQLVEEVRNRPDYPHLASLEDLLNRWKERTAKMEMLVGWIAEVNLRDAQLASQGVPYDLDASSLFLTHSAFPSLFLTQSDMRDIPSINIRDASYTATLPGNITTYTRLRRTENVEKIRKDTRAFLEFEGLLKPTSSD